MNKRPYRPVKAFATGKVIPAAFSPGRCRFAGRSMVVSCVFLALLAAPRFGSGNVPEEGDRSTFDLSLEGVEIRSLASLMSELTGRRFIVPDDVKERVSVVAPSISRSKVMPVFLSALSSVGLTVVVDDEVGRIVRLPDGSPGIGFVVPEDLVVKPEYAAEGLQTRVFRLRYAAAEDLRKLLEGMGSRRGAAGVLESANMLVVTDTPLMIRRVAELVDQLDQPGPRVVVDVVELDYADAEQTAAQLAEALRETKTRAGRLLERLPAAPGVEDRADGRSPPAIVASPHANRIIISGTQGQIDSLRALVERIDVAVPTGRSRLNAVFLSYINAEMAARSLNNLLERSAAAGQEARRRIAVEADTANNALLIDAMPQDFELVKRLLGQLDIAPEQVHISVLIVEVADTDDLTFGSEMTSLDLPGGRGDIAFSGATRFSQPDQAQQGMLDALQSGLFPQGITIGVGRGTRIDEAGNLVVGYPGILNLNALRERGKVDILSETSLEAQNNHEASLSIVDEIPVLKSTIIGGSGTARDIIRNIERMEVGVKLKMTPQIIPGGLVRVELNPSIEAITGDGGADGLTPVIAKRTVNTTVTVPDGESIVIAGLTRRDVQSIRRRVPLLGSVPLLGWFFRYDYDREARTNLLIFVTPRIVRDSADSRSISADWSAKTGISAPGTNRDQE